MADPIDYESALRDLLARRRRRRIVAALRRLADLRPSSPGQVMLVGIVLLLIGWLVPGARLGLTLGVVLLAVGFVSSTLQPRARQVTWRNRTITLAPEETWATRLYYWFYRRPKA